MNQEFIQKIAHLLRHASYAIETPGDLNRDELDQLIDELQSTAQLIYPLSETEETPR